MGDNFAVVMIVHGFLSYINSSLPNHCGSAERKFAKDNASARRSQRALACRGRHLIDRRYAIAVGIAPDHAWRRPFRTSAGHGASSTLAVEIITLSLGQILTNETVKIDRGHRDGASSTREEPRERDGRNRMSGGTGQAGKRAASPPAGGAD